MQENIFAHGVSLMIYGMGVVFIFLTLLVILTSLMSKVVGRFFKSEPVAAAPARVAPVPVTNNTVDDRTLKIIKAALQQHRSR